MLFSGKTMGRLIQIVLEQEIGWSINVIITHQSYCIASQIEIYTTNIAAELPKNSLIN